MILQGKLIVGEIKAIKAITDVFPIHQILGMKDNQSWHRVHGSTCQIIVFTHTDNIGIGELIVE
jgi:hypothetical protein